MTNIISTVTSDDKMIDDFFEIEADVPQIIQADVTTHKLTSNEENFPYTLNLKRSDFDNEKDLFKFIKSCETAIRRSPEYNDWREYIKEALGRFTCVISGEVNHETKVDLHHHPMSLFDITKSVIVKHMEKSEEFCSFDVASEVIETHYKNHVGYLPLVVSLHEKYHNGCLDIPMELVFGNYKEWLAQYGTYLDEEDLKRIYVKVGITKKSCNWKGYTWGQQNYPG